MPSAGVTRISRCSARHALSLAKMFDAFRSGITSFFTVHTRAAFWCCSWSTGLVTLMSCIGEPFEIRSFQLDANPSRSCRCSRLRFAIFERVITGSLVCASIAGGRHDPTHPRRKHPNGEEIEQEALSDDGAVPGSQKAEPWFPAPLSDGRLLRTSMATLISLPRCSG